MCDRRLTALHGAGERRGRRRPVRFQRRAHRGLRQRGAPRKTAAVRRLAAGRRGGRRRDERSPGAAGTCPCLRQRPAGVGGDPRHGGRGQRTDGGAVRQRLRGRADRPQRRHRHSDRLRQWGVACLQRGRQRPGRRLRGGERWRHAARPAQLRGCARRCGGHGGRHRGQPGGRRSVRKLRQPCPCRRPAGRQFGRRHRRLAGRRRDPLLQLWRCDRRGRGRGRRGRRGASPGARDAPAPFLPELRRCRRRARKRRRRGHRWPRAGRGGQLCHGHAPRLCQRRARAARRGAGLRYLRPPGCTGRACAVYRALPQLQPGAGRPGRRRGLRPVRGRGRIMDQRLLCRVRCARRQSHRLRAVGGRRRARTGKLLPDPGRGAAAAGRSPRRGRDGGKRRQPGRGPGGRGGRPAAVSGDAGYCRRGGTVLCSAAHRRYGCRGHRPHNARGRPGRAHRGCGGPHGGRDPVPLR